MPGAQPKGNLIMNFQKAHPETLPVPIEGLKAIYQVLTALIAVDTEEKFLIPSITVKNATMLASSLSKALLDAGYDPNDPVQL
jgi:hypothetical protein